MDDLQDIEKLTNYLKNEGEENETALRDSLFDLIDEEEDVNDDGNEYQLEFEDPDLLEDYEPSDLAEKAEDEYRTEEIKVQHELLTNEDQNVINKCTDDSLKSLMIANRMKHSKLLALNEKLINLLHSCRQEIKKLKETPAYAQPMFRQYVYRLGYPYFKDKYGYPSPWNPDVLRKRKNNELIGAALYMENTKVAWKDLDKSNLITAVQKLYVNYVVKGKEEAIQTLKDSVGGLQSKADKEIIQRKILEIEFDICKLKCSKTQLPIPNTFEIDWEAASQMGNQYRHTSAECKTFWNIYLNPSINKDSWTKAENKKLAQLARKYEVQNWDLICRKLGTKRSGYILCLHFYDKLCDKFEKNKKFSNEEDELLKSVVENVRIGNFIPWRNVRYFFDNRSKSQLYHRYTRCLTRNVQKGKFSEAEDVMIQFLHKKTNGDWNKIAEHIPNRHVTQLRDHYYACLRNRKEKYDGRWKIEEDREILNHVKIYGEKQWAVAHKLIESGRCRANIRHRYQVLKKWLKKNPGGDIKLAPRRQMVTQRQDYQTKGHVIQLLLEKLEREYDENNVPPLEELEKQAQEALETNTLLRNFKESTLDSEDEELTHYFRLEIAKTQGKLNTPFIDEAAANVKTLLRIFGAELELPEKDSIEKIATLDEHDKQILCLLKDEPVAKSSEELSITHLLPPNSLTLLGCRNLILDMESFKAKTASCSNLDMEVFNDHESDVFCRRFKCLMKWPALLATVNMPEGVKEQIIEHGKMFPAKKAGRPPNKNRHWKVDRMNQKKNKEVSEAQGSAESTEVTTDDVLHVENPSNEKENAVIVPTKTYKTYSRKKVVTDTAMEVNGDGKATTFAVASTKVIHSRVNCFRKEVEILPNDVEGMVNKNRVDPPDLARPGSSKTSDSISFGTRKSKRFKKS